MYRIIRNTHLIVGLFSVTFLLMYGVSSAQMAHQWNTGKPAVTNSETMVTTGLSARDAARALMEKGAVRGEVAQARKDGETWRFRVVRPGTVHEVTYEPATGAAKIATNTAGVMAMLNRFHHVGGLWHEFTLTNVWAILVGLVSAGLLVLAASGIYMWFKIHSERKVGGVILTVHLIVSLTLLVMIRTA